MEAGRVTLSIVLATILTLSTLVAPSTAQIADDPKQPSEMNNTMVILGSQDLANGFMHFDDENCIDGAILTPLQCKEDKSTFQKPVINFSSWFMLKKSRGIKAVNFAKFFL